MSHQDFSYERRVTALLQTNGYYLERNRKTPQNAITELDAVAIRFAPGDTKTRVVEYKNSAVTCTDALKAAGRTLLLDKAEGAIVASGPPSGTAHFRDFCQRLGVVAVTDAPDAASVHQHLAAVGWTASHDPDLCNHWSAVYLVEDAFKRVLDRCRDSAPPDSPPRRAHQYLSALDCDMWWRYRNCWSRAKLSYDLHFKHRRVAQDVAAHFQAGTPYAHAGAHLTPQQHLRVAFAYGRCPPAQAAMYVQTRARIAVLAAACECALSPPETRPAHTDWLPARFRQAVSKLEETPDLTAGLVPFLQTWVLGWGAFFVLHRQEEEQQVLAQQLGDDPANIPRYIDLVTELLQIEPDFDLQPGSWLAVITPQGNPQWQIRTMKLIAEPVKGLGILARRLWWSPEEFAALPEFMRDWAAWVPSYVSRLAAPENGTGPYDWQSIDTATEQHRQPAL